MEITFAKKLNTAIENEWIGIKAIIDGVEMSIPLNPDNRHYAAIMEQVNTGILTIAEADNGE
jgi:hypothetical protein